MTVLQNTEPAPRKVRVLCVDDEPSIRHILTLFLEREGHEVAVAKNGREALDAVSRGPQYDIIVTDSEMPEMNGMALVEALRTSHYTGKVIVFSSTLTAERQSKLRSLGVHAIVEKGGSFENFREAVRSAAADR